MEAIAPLLIGPIMMAVGATNSNIKERVNSPLCSYSQLTEGYIPRAVTKQRRALIGTFSKVIPQTSSLGLLYTASLKLQNQQTKREKLQK
jgi:hypothetical protein